MGAGSGGNFGRTKGREIIYRENEHGYFGTRGKSKDSKVRHLSGGKKEAKKFFDDLTKGYKSEETIERGIKRKLADGGTVVYRPTSSSDGTPVVSMSGGRFKPQKIHFVEQ